MTVVAAGLAAYGFQSGLGKIILMPPPSVTSPVSCTAMQAEGGVCPVSLHRVWAICASDCVAHNDADLSLTIKVNTVPSLSGGAHCETPNHESLQDAKKKRRHTYCSGTRRPCCTLTSVTIAVGVGPLV